MTIIIKKHKLAFFSAPKVACTSIKTALFKVENGFEFRKFTANGAIKHIHNVAYPAIMFSAIPADRITGFYKMTLVRDPIFRFLSCYSNRVVHYRELSEKNLPPEAIAEGLPTDPTIHEFVEHLEKYRSHSRSIRLHTARLVAFLGEERTFFDKIYGMDDIPEMEADISARTRTSFVLPHLQTGGEKVSPSVLTAGEIRKLERFYAKDYEVFGPDL